MLGHYHYKKLRSIFSSLLFVRQNVTGLCASPTSAGGGESKSLRTDSGVSDVTIRITPKDDGGTQKIPQHKKSRKNSGKLEQHKKNLTTQSTLFFISKCIVHASFKMDLFINVTCATFHVACKSLESSFTFQVRDLCQVTRDEVVAEITTMVLQTFRPLLALAQLTDTVPDQVILFATVFAPFFCLF